MQNFRTLPERIHCGLFQNTARARTEPGDTADRRRVGVARVLNLVGMITISLTVSAGYVATAEAAEISFDSARAYGYLKSVCAIGRRVSGSEGMQRQQSLLIRHFQKLGADMKAQRFDVPHPVTGSPVRMTNLVVSFDPSAQQRVLICCHYDTRPYPDRDILRPRGTFIGANDGASGVALLMELGNQMRTIKPRYGVDFIFFDGEELVFNDGDPYFLGSEHFSRWYAAAKPGYRYVAGVLVDMIGDRSLQLSMEKNSFQKAPAVTRSVWSVAKRLRVREFIGRVKHEVRDDHLALNDIAGIPTCDIIDFDYRYWHTTRDTPMQCSAASLGKVGRVLLHWMVEVPIDRQQP
ncbi:MAG: M28 family peptidase [Planctomycetaceae bacterium]